MALLAGSGASSSDTLTRVLGNGSRIRISVPRSPPGIHCRLPAGDPKPAAQHGTGRHLARVVGSDERRLRELGSGVRDPIDVRVERAQPGPAREGADIAVVRLRDEEIPIVVLAHEAVRHVGVSLDDHEPPAIGVVEDRRRPVEPEDPDSIVRPCLRRPPRAREQASGRRVRRRRSAARSRDRARVCSRREGRLRRSRRPGPGAWEGAATRSRRRVRSGRRWPG